MNQWSSGAVRHYPGSVGGRNKQRLKLAIEGDKFFTMKKAFFVLFLFILLVPAVSQEAARDLFRLGEERFQFEDDPLAAEYFQRLLAQYPLSGFSADARFRLGQIAYRAGEYESAGEQFDRISRRFRGTQFLTELPFWQGLTAHALKSYQEAVNYLSAYLEQESPQWEQEALLYQGLSLQNLGNNRKASEVLQTLVEKQRRPGGYEVTLLGHIYLEDQRFRQLKELIERFDLQDFTSPWKEQLMFLEAEAVFAEDPQVSRSLYEDLTLVPGQVGL